MPQNFACPSSKLFQTKYISFLVIYSLKCTLNICIILAPLCRKLTQLEGLELCNGHLKDEGIKHLEPLSALTSLSLAQNSCISDASLLVISKLVKLRTLNLAGCVKVSGNGIQTLQTLKVSRHHSNAQSRVLLSHKVIQALFTSQYGRRLKSHCGLQQSIRSGHDVHIIIFRWSQRDLEFLSGAIHVTRAGKEKSAGSPRLRSEVYGGYFRCFCPRA